MWAVFEGARAGRRRAARGSHGEGPLAPVARAGRRARATECFRMIIRLGSFSAAGARAAAPGSRAAINRSCLILTAPVRYHRICVAVGLY